MSKLTTKKALVLSFKEILNKKDLDKITIEEITKNASLNRKTFYYHFSDIYDLIEWIYINEVVEGLKVINDYDDWKKAYLFISDYILKNKKFIISTYKLSPLNKFIYNQTETMIMKILNRNTEGFDLNEKNKKFISKFYSYAFVGILGDWIENGMIDNSKEIINSMDKIFERYTYNLDKN